MVWKCRGPWRSAHFVLPIRIGVCRSARGAGAALLKALPRKLIMRIKTLSDRFRMRGARAGLVWAAIAGMTVWDGSSAGIGNEAGELMRTAAGQTIGPLRTASDTVGEVKIRCIDAGALGCTCTADPSVAACPDATAHDLPDLKRYRIGTWLPDDASVDVFAGAYESTGSFFRFDLILEGFFNPPGPANFVANFALPFQYGDNPVFGFVEFDVDQNMNTGGELAFPRHRYLGVVGRFGGLPLGSPGLAIRAAKSGEDFNTGFGPVHRSGEEFHLVLVGGVISTIVFVRGDNDGLFEPGEAWELTGEFLHRAHGYDPFALGPFFCDGGRLFGEDRGGNATYIASTRMLFEHQTDVDTTTISVVFPLTNEGAALMDGLDANDAECLNADPSDQASVLEALDDLQASADFLINVSPSGDPRQAIIDEWLNENPADFLNPVQWDLTVVLGTASLATSTLAPPFVWTDVHPNVVVGDFNNDGVSDGADMQIVREFILNFDGGIEDADGVQDEAVHVLNFAENFVLFDVTYDGVVSEADLAAIATPGDLNLDGAINLLDFATFSRCFGSMVTTPPPACSFLEARRSDLDGSGFVNLADFASFALNFGV